VLKLLLVAALILSAAAPVRSGAAPSPAPSPAGSTPAPPAAGAKPAAPTTVPVPEVVQRADEVAKLIRDLESVLLPGPLVIGIEKRLPEIAERNGELSRETTRQIEEEAAPAALDELTAQWGATRAVLAGYVETLAQRARSIEDAMERLTSLTETWTHARTDARASRAPGPVIQRIDGVLTSLADFREQMQAQRAANLVLQDRAAREVAQCETMLARIAALRVDVAGRLLERSGAVWDVSALVNSLAELPERIRSAAAADAAQLRQLAHEQRLRLGLRLALILMLAGLLVAARRRVADGGPILERPLSAAMLVALFSTTWVQSPAPPRAAVAVGQVLALVAALRLMPLLVTSAFTPRLYVIGALLLTDLLRHFTAVVPALERQIFVLEMVAAISMLVWQAMSRPQRRPLVMRALIAVFAAALGAAMVGYVNLGLLLGAGVLGSAYFAFTLYASLRVADGMVTLALRLPPLSNLGMVRRRGFVIERRAHGVLRALAVVTWAVLSLRYFGLWNAAVDAAQAALGAELKRGALSLSLGDVLVFVVTVVAAFWVSGLIRFVLQEDVFPRLRYGRALPSTLSTLVHYGILVLGFLLGLAVLGVDLTKVTILAGAFGVGIGFGLQGIVNNFVSGLILLVERRIDVGDAVQIADVAGQVQHMGMRACTVRTAEGAEVIVPNASLVSERVANWTLSDRLKRVDVPLGVAYGTPPEQVIELLLGVARAHKEVLLEPTPIALFLGFGDSALKFELRVWIDRFERWIFVQSELAIAVYEALQSAGIASPVPQHEVRLRS